MLAELRAAVVAVLKDKLALPIWDIIPDDIAELPCIVVAMPGARETSTAVIFDVTLDVVVIARRQQAGGNEVELVTLADEVWTTLGATRGVRHEPGDLVIAVTRLDPRTITIAGQECPAYIISVESSIASC